jgi:hypothetical protein
MSDRAGVDDGDVSGLSKGNEAIAAPFEGREEGLRLKLVDFATEGRDRNGRHLLRVTLQSRHHAS